MPTLLIIDDEANVLYALEKGLRSEGLKIVTASTGKAGIEAVKTHSPDVVICDIRLPDMSGLDVFARLREIDHRLPVILITAHATTEMAIEAMKRGAFDYLYKPFELDEVHNALDKALELSRLSRIPAIFDQDNYVESDNLNVDRIIGASRQMQTMYKEIGRVAPQDVNVLILGESGTGKELVARAIFQHSARSDKPFLAINCAAIPESLLESELFGHEKGAFTSADRRRVGKFEQAHGGTLFLDEIGDMGLATQAKVLRILQDGRFERVGGNETIESNVRIIAATNRDLNEMISQKTFREDLFYRLNTFTIYLPSLRERLSDLSLLVEYFVKRFRGALGKNIHGVSPEFMQQLSEHQWPGNVRELQSAIKYAIVRTTGDILTSESLPFSVSTKASSPIAQSERLSIPPASLPSQEKFQNSNYPELRQYIHNLLLNQQPDINDLVHAEVDRILYQEVLTHVSGHQSQAAELLGISRTTLRSRLQSLGMVVEKAIHSKSDAEE